MGKRIFGTCKNGSLYEIIITEQEYFAFNFVASSASGKH